MDEFLNAYITAALWSSVGGDDEPMDAAYGSQDIAPETLAAMRAECEAFLTANREHIGDRLGDAGHDFWLTRNGHGAGFWDGDWPEPAATVLTDAAHAARERDLYVGDDGKVYQA